MRTVLAIAAVVLLWSAASAHAHRLDECLVATTVRLDKGSVAVEVRLTPGVAVAGPVLGDVDADGDGAISDAERDAFAGRVAGDLSLAVDGAATPLRLTSAVVPPVGAIRGGAGEIVLRFAADVPAGGGVHSLAFEDRYRPPGGPAVYLVNCLVPRDPDLRVTGQDRSYDQSTYRLTYAQSASPAKAETSWADRAGGRSLVAAYLYHGVRHILTGYDHLLFVAALVLGATTLWGLVKVVSAFTVAHTLTLTLAAAGVVHVSPRVVEVLIAGSIVFVAVQNVWWPARSRGWTRLWAAFFFGLFHGLGFAGGLLDGMGEMPGGTMAVVIMAFSVGVEAGHQMVVLPLFACLEAARSTRPDAVARARWSMAVLRVGSAGISVAGAYYLCLAIAGGG